MKVSLLSMPRLALKMLSIKLRAKPLGIPKAVDVEHVRPGERNPIEGKFGQAKTAYCMNRIKARLQQTSQSWIATIVLVLNLVKLAGRVPVYIICDIVSYSANRLFKLLLIIKLILVASNKNEKELCLT